MKKSLFATALLILSISVLGCSSSSSTTSSFKEKFTIGTIVEENAHYLLPGSRVLFGSEAGSSDQPFTQKQEEMAIQIYETEIPAFIAALRSGIEDSIIKSGAEIDGKGSGGVTGTSFSIHYRQDEAFGVINLWGVPGKETDFFLLVLVTENNLSSSY